MSRNYTTCTNLWANSVGDKLILVFLFLFRHFMQIICFLRKIEKNVSKCSLLKFLPRVLSVKGLVCITVWN